MVVYLVPFTLIPQFYQPGSFVKLSFAFKASTKSYGVTVAVRCRRRRRRRRCKATIQSAKRK